MMSWKTISGLLSVSAAVHECIFARPTLQQDRLPCVPISTSFIWASSLATSSSVWEPVSAGAVFIKGGYHSPSASSEVGATC